VVFGRAETCFFFFGFFVDLLPTKTQIFHKKTVNFLFLLLLTSNENENEFYINCGLCFCCFDYKCYKNVFKTIKKKIEKKVVKIHKNISNETSFPVLGCIKVDNNNVFFSQIIRNTQLKRFTSY